MLKNSAGQGQRAFEINWAYLFLSAPVLRRSKQLANIYFIAIKSGAPLAAFCRQKAWRGETLWLLFP